MLQLQPGSLGEPQGRDHRLEITTFRTVAMVLSLFLFFWSHPPVVLTSMTPVQKYVALERQKLMLFEYGQPFKLHKRSRAELYMAAVGG
ncbi:hypothetical protein [Limnohabitans sp. Rim8]|uniref:hypothetical protein n=1 Tax=Limnohabitans sp. Rim8 TaxID=1100718 RepID=UPI0025DE5ADD|nr:hypothetical protein [Limnohabitans sp. Rim8]